MRHDTGKNKMQEKLTPIYSIIYKSSVDSLSHNYGSGLGRKISTPTYNAKRAIIIAKRIEKKEGKLVTVYQYGWKERGFRSNEEQCKIIYQSKNW